MQFVHILFTRFPRYIYSATGGADSGPASLEGSPSEDKEGQQAFGGGEFLKLRSTIYRYIYTSMNGNVPY